MSVPTSPPSTWRDLLRIPGKIEEIDLEAVIGCYFPGDADFTKAVVDAMEGVLSSGDLSRWAELKRLDAHAARHQRIATDHLLNLASMLICRVCSVSGVDWCVKFRDIVLDRIETFHNQCRDEVPQSVSRHKARFEYLHPYNVKTYASVLTLVGTVLTKGDETTSTELAKRVASNHNHWFNFLHLVDFTRSLIDGVARDMHSAAEVCLQLSPAICLVIAGMCGSRLGVALDSPALIEQTGVVTPTWVGSLLVDLLEASRMLPSGGRDLVMSTALNTLATLSYRRPSPQSTMQLVRSVFSRVVQTFSSMSSLIPTAVGEELLSFLLCCVRFISDPSEWHQLVELESACVIVFSKLSTASQTSSDRLKTLVLKWIRVMCYGPVVGSAAASAGSLLCWRSLLGLDSVLFEFVVSCLSADDQLCSVAAVEVVRVMLQRDSLVVPLFPRNELSPAAELLVRGGRAAGSPLHVIMVETFKSRRCRKSCAYILQQCLVRCPVSARQVLFDSNGESSSAAISSNIARVLLDAEWDAEVDLNHQLDDVALIDLVALVAEENKTVGMNVSNRTLIGLNSVLETSWLNGLECWCERNDVPLAVNDRIEYWLMHDNPLATLASTPPSVYHAFSARLVALLALVESSGRLTSDLLGLVETSTGVLNNELEKDLVGIDALFLLLDHHESPASLMQQLEYLVALRVVVQSMDEPVNQTVMLRFVQYRFVNRFSVLSALLREVGGMAQEGDKLGGDSGVGAVLVQQVSELLRLVGVELMVASQLVDIDAEHVRNMRDFASCFIVADVAKGSSTFIELLESAFTLLPVDNLVPTSSTFALPELRDPRIDGPSTTGRNAEVIHHMSLAGLVESVASVLMQWAAIASQSEISQVVPFLIESVSDEGEAGEMFFKFNWYTKIVPKLYSLLNGDWSLQAFNLRSLKRFVSEWSACSNPATKGGIIEAIAYAANGFVGSAEIWMIENDPALAQQLVDSILSFVFEIVESSELQQIELPLAVLASLLATRKGFGLVETVKDRTSDKFRINFEKALKSPRESVRGSVSRIIDIVEQEILYKELGI